MVGLQECERPLWEGKKRVGSVINGDLTFLFVSQNTSLF